MSASRFALVLAAASALAAPLVARAASDEATTPFSSLLDSLAGTPTSAQHAADASPGGQQDSAQQKDLQIPQFLDEARNSPTSTDSFLLRSKPPM